MNAVLNHTTPPLTDNKVNCDDIKGLIAKSRNGRPGRDFSVVDTLIANCHDPEEAGRIVLDRALSYLMQNIKSLDTQYLSSRRNSLAHLQEEIDRELEKARQIADLALSQERDSLLFMERFKELWENLNNELVALVDDMRKEQSKLDPNFASYFASPFERCRSDSGLPTRERVKAEMIDEHADINAYNHFLDELRTHLTDHFVNMDGELKFSMDSVKDKVANVFIEHGQLKNLMIGVPSSEFFRIMAEEKIPVGRKHLREVFRAFAKYELSLRGFFQSRIRAMANDNKPNLDNLIPNRTKIKPIPTTPDGVLTPEIVLQTLKKVHKEAVDSEELRHDLRTLMESRSDYRYEAYTRPQVRQILIPQQE